MSTEETRDVIERAISLGMENYEAIANRWHSEDVVKHGSDGDDYGREGWKRRQARFVDAFSGRRWTAEPTPAGGGLAASRFTFTGTRTGNLEDTAPTGKRVKLTGMIRARISNGRVAEIWAQVDRLAHASTTGCFSSA